MSTLELVAYHEAGHVVALLKYDLPFKRVTIVPSSGARGKVSGYNPLRGVHLDYDDSDRARARAEKAIIIALAGPAAQRRFRPRSWRHAHGRTADRRGDYDQTIDIALRLHGNDETMALYLRYLKAVARDLIEDHWWHVETLARALLARGTLARALLARGTLTREQAREVVWSALQELGGAGTAALAGGAVLMDQSSEDERPRESPAG